MGSRFFISCGDASADQHAAALVRALRQQAPDVEIEAVGGPALAAEGVPLLADLTARHAMGFKGVVQSVPYHLKLGEQIEAHLKTFRPHGVIFMDYGGFNLRLAKKLKYRHYYYIAPQVWASRPGRLKVMQKHIDKVFGIFPFEQVVYQDTGIEYQFVGHPLVHQLPPPVSKADFCQKASLDPTQPLIALFPGSRAMELDYLLKPLLAAMPLLSKAAEAEGFPGLQVVIAQAPNLKDEPFRERLSGNAALLGDIPVKIVQNQNHAVLSAADVAIGSSGTTTLEAALYQTPMVIAYKLSWLSHQIMQRYITVPFLGLPNLLAGKQVLPELIQNDLTPEALVQSTLPYLNSQSKAFNLAQEAFKQIRQQLGTLNAAEEVATTLLAESSVRVNSL